MNTIVDKYVNPFTDFGFKKIFGEEINKNLLKDFLNELLREEEGEIKELTYLNNENLPKTEEERRAIFDLYCVNEKGEKFIVELQKSKQKHFKSRTLYYSTFPIQQQAEKGEWDFKLEKVYMIAILDFVFDEDKDYLDKYLYNVKLKEMETNDLFTDKLNFIYLSMPKFNKTIDELETKFDKWLYAFKNLNLLEEIPKKLNENIFIKLFETAEIANLKFKDYKDYEESLKVYRDLKNSLDTSKEEGMEIGRAEGIKIGTEKGIKIGKEQGIKIGIEKNVINMLKKGFEISVISDITELSENKILEIKNKANL